MSEHSPGPWKFERCTLGHPDNAKNPMVTAPAVVKNICRLFSEESTFFGCTSLGPSLEQAEANARLIAASPTLLEACEQFLAAHDGDDALAELQAVNLIRNAIQAAKGE